MLQRITVRYTFITRQMARLCVILSALRQLLAPSRAKEIPISKKGGKGLPYVGSQKLRKFGTTPLNPRRKTSPFPSGGGRRQTKWRTRGTFPVSLLYISGGPSQCLPFCRFVAPLLRGNRRAGGERGAETRKMEGNEGGFTLRLKG